LTRPTALGFALVVNHPFLDGNKRVGHTVMEVFSVLNGHELDARLEEQERVMLDVAAGTMNRATWPDH
jgi:death-on-curing protein